MADTFSLSESALRPLVISIFMVECKEANFRMEHAFGIQIAGAKLLCLGDIRKLHPNESRVRDQVGNWEPSLGMAQFKQDETEQPLNAKLLYIGMTRAKEKLLLTASVESAFTEKLAAMAA